MKKTIVMGLCLGVISATLIASSVLAGIPKVSAISDPDERSARDYSPGNEKKIGDPNQRSARDYSPGHSEIGDPNSVAPGSVKKFIK